MPSFPTWIQASISSTINNGEEIDKDTMHMSMPPTLEVMLYYTMYAWQSHLCFERKRTFNHEWLWCSYNFWTRIHIGLKWSKVDSCQVGICRLGWKGIWIELWGAQHHWVKANYNGSNATIKWNEYGFTFVFFFFYSHFRLVICFSPTCRISLFFQWSKIKKVWGSIMERTPRKMANRNYSNWPYKTSYV